MSDQITTPSGLKYIDETVGTGDSPTRGKKVRVHYNGRLTDGKSLTARSTAARRWSSSSVSGR